MTNPRRVRVLWLSKGLGPGGAERLLVEHAAVADFGRFEYEAAYLLPWKRHLVAELEALGVPTHCLGVGSEADPRWLTRLAGLIRARRFDVVHSHSPLSSALSRLLVRLLPQRAALAYTEHNSWKSYHPVTRLANRATFRLNDAVFAVSADVRSSVPPHLRERVAVLQHGIGLDRVRAHAAERDEVRRELGAQDDDVLVVTVANLRAEKNYPDLLDAARVLVDSHESFRFVAAGQGQLETEIRAKHDALGLDGSFLLLGYVPDAARLIAGADVFVLASSHEGLPVAVMEALALGVPVVAPAVGGLREAIRSGENGLLVAPGDSVALADAIRRLRDPMVRAHLAVGARRSGDQYSSRVAVARLEETYRRLAVRRASAATA